MKQSKKDIFLEILRFLIVGCFTTLLDYITFYLFNLVILKNIDASVNLGISTCLGFLVGMLSNWCLQRFIYKAVTNNQMHDKKVFIKYVLLSVFGLGVTELGMQLGKPTYDKLTLTIFGVSFQFWKLFFKVLMTCIVLVINYLGRKFIVFKPSKEEIVESNKESNDNQQE